MNIVTPSGRYDQRLREAVASLAPTDGTHKTAVDGVEAIRWSHPMGRTPVLYKSGIAFLAQGRKRGFLGGKTFEYSPDTYLVLASPLPLEVELRDVSPARPSLCLYLGVDTALLRSLAHAMDQVSAHGAPPVKEPPRAVFATPFDARMRDAVTRLAEALLDPVDAHILGDGIRREIVYRTLLGPQADALRAVLGRDSAAARVARVLRDLHAAPERAMSVNDMAQTAGMSISAFHAAFKAATALAPIQYQKAVRLHRAQALMAFDGKRVSEAAYEVGYASASQFSRDYKRLFGMSPSQGAREIVTASAS
jgi:AraC-like DNA-binding protein